MPPSSFFRALGAVTRVRIYTVDVAKRLGTYRVEVDLLAAAAAKAAAASAAPAATGKLTLNKAETIANLAAGQIPHDPAASHKSLYELLLNGVKNALSEAGITYDAASTDAKALLDHFPKA